MKTTHRIFAKGRFMDLVLGFLAIVFGLCLRSHEMGTFFFRGIPIPRAMRAIFVLLGAARLLYAVRHARKNKLNRVRLETYGCLKDVRDLYRNLGFHLIQSNKDTKKYGPVFHQEIWETQLLTWRSTSFEADVLKRSVNIAFCNKSRALSHAKNIAQQI